jgi:hypothetical protein
MFMQADDYVWIVGFHTTNEAHANCSNNEGYEGKVVAAMDCWMWYIDLLQKNTYTNYGKRLKVSKRHIRKLTPEYVEGKLGNG